MEYKTPVYECRRVPNGSIRVDGKLDDPGWQSIQTVGDFILADGYGPAARQTEAWMCWDDAYLYISFACDDPDIWGTMFDRDDPIYEEEVVEAFIDPDSDLTCYYELQTSPHGTLFDAIIHNPTGLRRDMKGDTSWTCEGWLVGVQVDGTLDNRGDLDKGWTVEWAIPFASLTGAPNTPPKDGDTWRINLYRIDRTPTPEFGCWSPTLEVPPNFHVPTRFGIIVFRE
jgi:hypothetical protein